MKGILIPAQIEGIRSRKDRTMAVTLGTQELEPDKASGIFGLNGRMAIVYISPKEKISNEEMEILDGVEVDMPGKTPSRRLRGVLYRLWEHDPGGYKDHNLHYLHHMEKIIEHYKSKLPQ